LGKITSWARDANSRDKTETSVSGDRDIVNFCQDEMLVRLKTETSRPRPHPC